MTISMSGTMVRFVGHQRQVEVDAPDARAALLALVDRYPEARPVLFDAEGSVRQVHRLFVNGEMLEPGDLTRPLQRDDRIEVVTAVAGG